MSSSSVRPRRLPHPPPPPLIAPMSSMSSPPPLHRPHRRPAGATTTNTTARLVMFGLLLLPLLVLSSLDLSHGFKIDARQQTPNAGGLVISRTAKLINHKRLASIGSTTTTVAPTTTTISTTTTTTTAQDIDSNQAGVVISYREPELVTTPNTNNNNNNNNSTTTLDVESLEGIEGLIAAGNGTEAKPMDKSSLLQGRDQSIFLSSRPSTRRPFINFTSLIKPTKSSGAVVQKKYVIIDKRKAKGNGTEGAHRTSTLGDWSRRKSSELRVPVADQPTLSERQRSKKKTLVKVKVVTGKDQILVYTSTTPSPTTTVTADSVGETTTVVTLPEVNETVNATLRSDNAQFERELEATTTTASSTTMTTPPTSYTTTLRSSQGRRRLKTTTMTTTEAEITTPTTIITTNAAPTTKTITTTTTAKPVTTTRRIAPTTATNKRARKPMTTTVMPADLPTTSVPTLSTEEPLDMFAPVSMLPDQYFDGQFNPFASTSSTEMPFYSSSSSMSYLDYSGEFGDFGGGGAVTSSTMLPPMGGVELLDKDESGEGTTTSTTSSPTLENEVEPIGRNGTLVPGADKESSTSVPLAQNEDTSRRGKLSSLQIVLIGFLIAIGSIIFVLVGALAYISWSKLKITPEEDDALDSRRDSPPVKIVMPPEDVHTNVGDNGRDRSPNNLLQPPEQHF